MHMAIRGLKASSLARGGVGCPCAQLRQGQPGLRLLMVDTELPCLLSHWPLESFCRDCFSLRDPQAHLSKGGEAQL